MTEKQWPATEVNMKDVAHLVPYANNARLHSREQVDQIAASIQEWGWTVPVLIDEDNGIIAGHGRVLAAQKLEITEIPVMIAIGWTPAQKKAYVLADNRLAENSTWDDDLLQIELNELQSLDFSVGLTGFEIADIQPLEDPADADKDCEDPPIPEVPEDPTTSDGDIWELGDHRIMCGDCRRPEDMNKLFGENLMDMAFTSPPYASQRKYDESSGFKPIHPDEFVDWFDFVQANVQQFLAKHGSWFVNIKEHCDDGQRHLYVKDLTLTHVRQWGWMFVDEFAWTKQGVPGGYPNRFKNGWEPVFHFSMNKDITFNPDAVGHKSDMCVDTDEKENRGQTISGFTTGFETKTGIARPTNVLNVATPNENNGHTAVFPVGLPKFFVKAYSNESDIVFDPFMGSGSTLIACEDTGRKGYGMEISRGYCDVIVKRWEDYTNKKAKHIKA